MTDALPKELTCDDLKERLVALEKLLADPQSECYVERLLDVVIAAVNDSSVVSQCKENRPVYSFFKRFANVAATLQSHRRQPQDFSLIASLGHGAFGRVQLVREISTGRVCAMKVLKKSRMLNQHTDYWVEREIMARGESPWIVQLYYAFQDITSLYMVMEYVPGGNLVGWMEEVEVISEAACRFYAAETVLALADLHAMGFIHRDLKPDNLLLDAGGHLKLADFGTAVRVDPETHLIHCDAAVGTPDYLSPEVLLSQGAGGGSYGFEVDWWALGVLVYEMLYGDTPFYSETLVNTYAKIMSHAQNLHFPEAVHVSDSALDFMKQLLRDRETRLGSGTGGSQAVCNHPWFSPQWAESQQELGSLDAVDISLADWNWSNIRACRPPFQPHLNGETDTAYFPLEVDEETNRDSSPNNKPTSPDDDGNTHGCTEQHQEQSTLMNESESNRRLLNPTDSAEVDAFLSKFPSIQLAFAGFSFSSSHPNHLALLNGLHLAPRGLGPSSRSVGISVPEECGSSPAKSAPDLLELTPVPPVPVAEQNGSLADSSKPTTEMNVVPQAAHLRVQAQLEDALALSEMQSNEIISLTAKLDKALVQRRELEAKLHTKEAAARTASEEAQQRLELVRAEAEANLARLEAELVKWKSVAQSEQAARQSAEAAGSIAVATATAHLAKRAVEVAERVAGPGSRSNLSRMVSPTSSFIHSNEQIMSQSVEIVGTTVSDGELPAGSPPIDSQTVATNLLLSRVEEMAKRAHRAEAAARESTDALEAEQRFCRLYKDESEDKSDQIRDLTRELELLRDSLSMTQQSCQRSREEYESARRALAEEQQRSNRYREAARVAEEDAMAASQRATLAARESANLRNKLEEVNQAYENEKLKCSATVLKLFQVVSGENAEALESMRLANFQQNDETSSRLGSFYPAARNKLSNFRGLNVQLRQRDKENKRLLCEINRLNAELASAHREAQSRLLSAEGEIARLTEELRANATRGQENLDDSASYYRPNFSNSVHLRTRSGIFTLQRNKPGAPSLDSGIGSERNSTLHKSSVANPNCSPVSSSPELPPTHDSTNRQVSATERFLHAAQSSTPTHVSSDLPISPVKSSVSDITDFTFSGTLEYSSNQQIRRKKRSWERRIARLTPTHLLLWDCSAETGGFLSDQYTSGTDAFHRNSASSLNRISHISPPVLVLHLPLTALCHVRAVNSCDLIHERPEDLPRIFQVIYDLHCINNPVDADPTLLNYTPMQINSSTLPRKLSFGSSSVFSTHSANTGRRVVRTESASGSSIHAANPQSNRRSFLGSASHLDGLSTLTNNSNTTPGSSPVTTMCHSPVPNTLLVQGHKLQCIQFRKTATCDICRHPCSHFISPPPAVQCVNCQLKLHASHLEQQECSLPVCPRSVVICLFRCATEADKQQWIAHIAAAIKHVKSLASPTIQTSNSVSLSSTANPSHTQGNSDVNDEASSNTISTSSTTSNRALLSRSASMAVGASGTSIPVRCVPVSNQTVALSMTSPRSTSTEDDVFEKEDIGPCRLQTDATPSGDQQSQFLNHAIAAKRVADKPSESHLPGVMPQTLAPRSDSLSSETDDQARQENIA
ncbi:unnamed protein product [Calicophoron daubneyi]|uniref:non-specific serine/threonine protein kinase n=1 Tax=Calicophoron daubneyi TaxID=300641 RepID=A0AAV2TNH9_CALDB